MPDSDAEPVTLKEVFRNSVSYSSNGFDIVVPGVTALAIGLLPPSLDINLKRIENLNHELYHAPEDIKTIHDLLQLIRKFGSSSVDYYHAEFRDYPGEYLTFEKDEFVFSYSNLKLADYFIIELDRLIQ